MGCPRPDNSTGSGEGLDALESAGDVAGQPVLHDLRQTGHGGSELDHVVQPRTALRRREPHDALVVAQRAPAADAVADQLGLHGFDDGLVEAITAESVGAAAALSLPTASAWNIVGSGWATYADALRERLPASPRWADGDRYPQATDVALLAAPLFRAGKAVAAEQALPVYLRDKVALTLEEQRAVR